MTKLNANELLELQDFRDKANIGEMKYWQIYEWLGDLLEDKGVPLTDSSLLWLRGATEANAGNGAFSALIRSYTETQHKLRYGFAPSSEDMQKASDKVALNVIKDILGESGDWPAGEIPTIERIAQADAQAVGEGLFGPLSGHDATDSAFSQNSAWSGALLFGVLRSDQATLLMGKGIPGAVDTLSDWRDVLFSYLSYGTGLQAAFVEFLQGDAVQNARDLMIGGTSFAGFLSGRSESSPLDIWNALFNGTLNANLLAAFHVIKKVGVNKFIDLLIGARQGSSVMGVTTDANSTERMQSFFNELGPLIQNLRVNLNAIEPSALAAQARADVNARAALAALSPISIEVDEAVANQFDLYDRATGQGEITQNWIEDRAAFTSNFMKKLENLGGIINGTSNLRFLDISTQTQVLVGAGSAQRRHYVFGGEEADTANGEGLEDHLYGGAENDRLNGRGGNDYLQGDSGDDVLDGGDGRDTLIGGSGADTLSGGVGDDTLEGGSELDVYKFSADWGHDVIYDSAGGGTIQIDDIGTLSGGSKKIAENVWQTEDGRVVFALATNDEGESDLHISFTDRLDTITVKNWTPATDRNFGITLPTSNTLPTNDATLIGDFAKKTEGGNYVVNATGYVVDGPLVGAMDVINGTDSDETIYGLGGNDGLSGGQGDDLIYGGDGSDLILGGFGHDTINGGSGNDYIFGSGAGQIDRPLELDFIFPTAAGIEVARGFSWAAFQTPGVDPNDGSNIRFVGAGVSPVVAGPGGVFVVESTGNVIDGEGGDDYIIAGTGMDVVHGGDDSDEIVGMDGADVLFGDAGDDRIWGDGSSVAGDAAFTPFDAHADDILVGGAGNDYLQGQGGSDVLYGGADDDALWGDGEGADDPAAIHGADYLYGGDGEDRLEGGGLDDVLFGGSGDDRLWGDNSRAGVVTATYQGKDYLDGEQGDDQLHGGGGDDIVLGGSGNDLLWGDDGGDVTPLISQGQDYLDGGDGDDQVVGGGGNDRLLGGTGDDHIYGDDELERVDISAHGDDDIDAGAGNDIVFGGGGADLLAGGTGDDELFGEDGDDTVVGGQGVDAMVGGSGNDVYILAIGDSALNALGEAESIRDNEGENTIILQGASAGSLVVRSDGEGTLFLDSSSTDHLAIIDGGVGSKNTYELGDGSSYTYGQLVGAFSDGLIASADDAGRRHILGGKNNDEITETTAYATLSGGRGNDVLSGSGGHNTYLYEIGDGSDTLIDTSARLDQTGAVVSNRILFGTGIAAEDLSIESVAGSLVLKVGINPNDQITLMPSEHGSMGAFSPVENFEFADGTVLSFAQLLGDMHAGSAGNDTISGLDINDAISGHAGNDSLSGWGGNDELDAGAGDDILDGGSGADVLLGGDGYDLLQGGSGHDELSGGAGGDTFSLGGAGDQDGDKLFFNSGDGADQIEAGGATGNSIHFGQGIQASDIEVVRLGGNSPASLQLLLKYGVGDQIELQAGAAAHFDELVFSDGTTLSMQTLLETIQPSGASGADVLNGSFGHDLLEGGDGDDVLRGHGGGDVLDGGAGRDILVGGNGDNVYVFGSGSGYDLVRPTEGETATLRFEGVAAGALRASLLGNDLVIGAAEGDQVRIEGYGSNLGIASTWQVEVGNQSISLAEFLDSAEPLQSVSLAARKNQFMSEQFIQLSTWSQYYPNTSNASANGGSGRAVPGSVAQLSQQMTGGEVYYYASYLNYRSESSTFSVTYSVPVFGEEIAPSQTLSGTMVYLTDLQNGSTVPATYIDIPNGASMVYGTYQPDSQNPGRTEWGLLGWFVPDPIAGEGAPPRKIIGWTTDVSTWTETFTADEANQVFLQGTAGDDQVVAAEAQTEADVLFRGVIETGDGNDSILLNQGIAGPIGDWQGSDWGAVRPDQQYYGSQNAQFQPRGLGAWIDAGTGDDIVWGSDANDYIIGGSGDDLLNGGAGADTYFISINGDDQDQIRDTAAFDWGDPSTPGAAYFPYYGGDLANPNRDIVEFDANIELGDLSYQWNMEQVSTGYKTLELFHQGHMFLAIDYNVAPRPTERDVSLPGIERFHFATGQVLDLDALLNAIPVGAGNTPPVVADALVDQEIETGAAWTFSVPTGAFEDADPADALELSAILANGDPLPSWLSFDAATRTFMGTPGSGDTGALTLRVTATDLAGASVSQLFELNINAQPPASGEVIIGTNSAEELFGTSDDTTLRGLGGDDILHGGGGNDIIEGGDGVDGLYGDDGDDTLDGGAGLDYLMGGGGNNTFLLGRGDGPDEIWDGVSPEQVNTLQFKAGVSASDIVVQRTGNGWDLKLMIAGTDDQVTVPFFFLSNDPHNGNNPLQAVRFADGTSWDLQTILNKAGTGTAADDQLFASNVGTTLLGLDGDDSLNGGAGDDILIGGAGDDALSGADGNDVFDGGAGNEFINTGSGNSTYLFGRGDGVDEIWDGSGDVQVGTLQFKAGVQTSDVVIRRAGNGAALTVTIADSGDQVVIPLFFLGNDPTSESNPLQQVRFDDGTTWDLATILAKAATGTEDDEEFYASDVGTTLTGFGGSDWLHGGEGNDMFLGGAGDDHLFGASGNDTYDGSAGNDEITDGTGDDTYEFGRGDGQDLVWDADATAGNTDVVMFKDDISIDQLWFRQVNNYLEVSVIGTGDKITISNWFGSEDFHLEQFKTSDGHVLLDSQVQGLVDAMAAFAPPAAGQTTLPAAYQSTLGTVIAASWQ